MYTLSEAWHGLTPNFGTNQPKLDTNICKAWLRGLPCRVLTQSVSPFHRIDTRASTINYSFDFLFEVRVLYILGNILLFIYLYLIFKKGIYFMVACGQAINL